MNIPKILFISGLLLICAAGIVFLFQKTGIPLGRLPGDVHIKNDNSSFYFPITTCIIISIVISAIMHFIRK